MCSTASKLWVRTCVSSDSCLVISISYFYTSNVHNGNVTTKQPLHAYYKNILQAQLAYSLQWTDHLPQGSYTQTRRRLSSCCFTLTAKHLTASVWFSRTTTTLQKKTVLQALWEKFHHIENTLQSFQSYRCPMHGVLVPTYSNSTRWALSLQTLFHAFFTFSVLLLLNQRVY